MSTEGGAVPNRVCPNCKRLLDATWKACPYCGINVITKRVISKREMEFPNVCPRCKRVLDDATWKACPYCGRSTKQRLPTYEESLGISHEYESVDTVDAELPSQAWYLVPFFFGFLGGLIAYIGTHDRDRDMATKLLVFGLIWTIVLSFISWYTWISWINGVYH
jgi:RNA polymerase subunit RPABC4/transcription elongation factor Spt4